MELPFEPAQLREDELRILVQRTPAVVVILDRELRYLMVSDRWLEEHRMVGRDVIGLHHYDVLPEIPERWREIHRRCLDGAVATSDGDRFERADGTIEWIRWEIHPWHDRGGEIGGMMIFSEFITEQKRSAQFAAGQQRILELIATGAPLDHTLDELVRLVEWHLPGPLCSILVLDDEQRLRLSAAPSLPAAYNAVIEGIAIGEGVGSCGTAAHRGEPVVVRDIASDPLWNDYADVALEHGLRACWSTPILSTAGSVLGTFAIYYREPREPDEQHLRVIEDVTSLAGIAIARDRVVDELVRSERRYRELVELAPDMIAIHEAGRIVFVNPSGLRLLGASSPDELIGRPVTDVVHPDYHEIVTERIREVLVRLDGVPIDVEVAALPAAFEGRPAPSSSYGT